MTCLQVSDVIIIIHFILNCEHNVKLFTFAMTMKNCSTKSQQDVPTCQENILLFVTKVLADYQHNVLIVQSGRYMMWESHRRSFITGYKSRQHFTFVLLYRKSATDGNVVDFIECRSVFSFYELQKYFSVNKFY